MTAGCDVCITITAPQSRPVEYNMPNTLSTLTGHVHVAPDKETLFENLAMAVLTAASDAVGQRDAFHLALSGGSTPEPFYVHLVTDPRYRALPWDRTHLWIVDERRVPEEDPRSNYRMIRETLLDHVPMRNRQKHPMPVHLDDPGQAYEQELRELIPCDAVSCGEATDIPRLDFVLLGMGDDAHTASLFPNSDALNITNRLAAINDGPSVTPPPRVTMTYPLLNAARQIAVLVVGEKKAPALRRVADQLAKAPDPAAMPITGIHPDAGSLTWYLDAAAAGHG